MSAPRTGSRLGLTLAACTLLAACAVAPPKPAPRPATVVARPAPPPPIVAPIAPSKAENKGEPWTSLTAGFVLDDCADSSLVRGKIAMYTRSPTHFERLLRRSLPLLMYVQNHLQAADIPGEFAMLPMLESSYNPREPSRRGDPAGMWQLMPRTARSRGIVIDRHYDGRLDPVASTRVAIGMLTEFNKRFDDWRLTNMAYNAGQYAVLRALRKHPELGDGAIPDLPLSAITRKHLAKLLALSCILREPQRFHVELPQPAANDMLAAVKVPAGTRLATAAAMAEITPKKLRALNPGYLGASIPANSPRTLLLPAGAAQALAAALTVNNSESIAQVNSAPQHAGSGGNIPLPTEPAPPPTLRATSPAPTHASRQHRVRKGESLWSIAQHYHVSVDDLKRWNQLQSDTLHPGEILRVQR